MESVMKDSFSRLHPIVGIVYFAAVISFSMFLMNPVCLAVSLSCAVANAVQLNGRKTVLFGLKFILPTAVLVMLINPIVNHAGVTMLTYLPWDNPLTLESVVYGIASAVMLSSVVFWFSSFNKVMTADKLVYLFGKIAPALGLLLSMAFRFVPRFSAQFREVRTARKLLGREKSGFIEKIKDAVRVISVMLSHSLEDSIETADSMKARGYGLKGRTAYSNYSFTKRDAIALLLICISTASLIVLRVFGTAKYRYFPSVKGELTGIDSVIFFTLYFLLMIMPFVINIWEGIRWKRLQSAI